MMESIEEIYTGRIRNGKLNTSYPLGPSDWSRYRIEGKHPFAENEELSSYDEEYTYQLLKLKLLSKYIAISAYCGRFSIKTASEILEGDFISIYRPEIDFCIDNELMTLEDDTLYISRKGFMNYGAVFSLFYLK